MLLCVCIYTHTHVYFKNIYIFFDTDLLGFFSYNFFVALTCKQNFSFFIRM